MLTEVKVRNATAREKPYKLSDSGGLHLFVSTTGHRSWRLKYRFGGKEGRIVFGPYPEISLKRAREMRDDAKLALREGRDPSLALKRAKLARQVGNRNTFEEFARKWHDTQLARWKPVHANDVLTSMISDLFPVLGAYPVDEIDEILMLHALRKVEARGAIETAHRLRQRAERVFRFAASEGARNFNPAANVKDALKPVPPKKRWPAVTDLSELRRLIEAVDTARAAPSTRLASKFLALTAQRPGMVRNAAWSEIEGVDWDDEAGSIASALWRIPAEKMKQELELREEDAFEHCVPLSPAAISVLRVAKTLTRGKGIIFPGWRDSGTPLSENAIGYLYNREGWKGRHVPHGWRSSFSTIMNGRAERLYPGADRLVIDRLVIDLMLAHTPTGMSSNERRYNRQGYGERRRELANEWAELLLGAPTDDAQILNSPRRKKA